MSRNCVYTSTILVVLLCFCANGQQSRGPTTTTNRQVPTQYNELDNLIRFVIDLYRANFDNTKNYVMSPLSVRIMLSMFYYQAHGQTETDLRNYFYLDTNKTLTLAYHKYELNLLQRMNAYLKVVNKVYVNQNYQVNDDFRRTIYDYKGFLESIDVTQNVESARKVNEWIENETNGLIKDLVDRDTFSSDMIMLGLNTMYFKAKWLEPFASQSNRQEDFHQLDGQVKKVQMMTDTGDFVHAVVPELDAQVLEIHYEQGSNFVFWLILPNANSSLPELIKKFDYSKFNIIKNKLRDTSLDLIMPIFETETDIDCKAVLQRLGLQTVFEYRNEMPILTGASNNVRIDEMKQKTKIIVNTDGTEVASGSYTKFTLLSAKPTFRVNRPFLYAILTKDLHIPIFMGHYLKV